MSEVLEDVPLYRLPITKKMIEELPVKARRMLILSGAIANDMSEFHRLALFSLKDFGNRELNMMAHGQSWVILRVLIGKTFEAFKFVEKHLKETGEFYRDYLKGPLSDPKREILAEDYLFTAYDRVWARLKANRGLIREIRDTHAFHYDLKAYLEQGLAGLDESWETSVLMAGRKRHGNFNAFSEHAIVRSMLSLTGNSDLMQAMNALRDETTEASAEVWDLMEAIMLCIMEKHGMLNDIRVTQIATFTDAPKFSEFTIPPVCSD